MPDDWLFSDLATPERAALVRAFEMVAHQRREVVQPIHLIDRVVGVDVVGEVEMVGIDPPVAQRGIDPSVAAARG
jgi:hypothetical protein